MTDIWFARPMRAWLCLAATALLAEGCAPAAPTGPQVFAIDVAGGAKTCVAAPVSPPDGQALLVQVRMNNDGGWCGVTASRGGAAFDSYLLAVRPKHGTVFAHHVGAVTRIDYTPDPGFTGTDDFAVHMIPGNATIEEAVTVSQ